MNNNIKRKHERLTKVLDAMVTGITRAADLGLTKPDDVATSVWLVLAQQGFTIIRTPTRKEQE